MTKWHVSLLLLWGATLPAAPIAWFKDSCVLAKFIEMGRAFNSKRPENRYPIHLESCLDTTGSKTLSSTSKGTSILEHEYSRTLKHKFSLDSANLFSEELRFSHYDRDAKGTYPSTCTYSASITKNTSDAFNIDSLKPILASFETIKEDHWARPNKNSMIYRLSEARPTCEIYALRETNWRFGKRVRYSIDCTVRNSAFAENMNPCILAGLVQEEIKKETLSKPGE